MEKSIPLIQELRNMETGEDVKNYMFDTLTQIEKRIPDSVCHFSFHGTLQTVFKFQKSHCSNIDKGKYYGFFQPLPFI
jgi:hypothetical protein